MYHNSGFFRNAQFICKGKFQGRECRFSVIPSGFPHPKPSPHPRFSVVENEESITVMSLRERHLCLPSGKYQLHTGMFTLTPFPSKGAFMGLAMLLYL